MIWVNKIELSQQNHIEFQQEMLTWCKIQYGHAGKQVPGTSRFGAMREALLPELRFLVDLTSSSLSGETNIKDPVGEESVCQKYRYRGNAGMGMKPWS